jgi:hypothetical protein
MIIFLNPMNSAETEPTHNEVKKYHLIRCDAIIHSMRQSCLEFLIESVHFFKTVKLKVIVFYKLFILCIATFFLVFYR